jgi:hypothetical protein
MHASLPLVSGTAHLLRWAVLCRKCAGTPLDSDGVSTAVRHPRARIPMAHMGGVAHATWGACERALPDTHRGTVSMFTRQ